MRAGGCWRYVPASFVGVLCVGGGGRRRSSGIVVGTKDLGYDGEPPTAAGAVAKSRARQTRAFEAGVGQPAHARLPA